MESSIAAPIEYGRTALVFHRQVSLDEWREIGAFLATFTDALQWYWGDWIAYGERHYGEYTQYVDDAGVAVKTLQNWVYVAQAVEPSRRREDLSWSHHAKVASLDPDEQTRWLQQAADNGLSANALGEAIAGSKADYDVCPACGSRKRIEQA